MTPGLTAFYTKTGMIIRDREPSENIPWLDVRGDEACWFMCSRLDLKKVPSLADLGVVDV